MLEFLAFFAFFYSIYSWRERKRRRPKKFTNIDAEYRDLLESSHDATAIALQIRQLILDILSDTKSDAERFSDTRLAQAQAIIDRAGPNAVYWLADIAAQLSMLSAAHINGFSSNISENLNNSATPEQVLTLVAKV